MKLKNQKVMKKILVLFTFLSVLNMNAQKESAKAEFKDNTITSLVFTVDSVEELETIDWKDVKDIFKNNNEQDSIKLGYRVRFNETKKHDHEFKHSFEIKGKAGDIDGSIKIAKKVIKVISNL
ncbi:conserved exported hypothetical protein [Tenacibaculum sp. 190524A05c]|uniref:Uncharacterized protein n=2 Tax=Tenacibaculum platacis TaxID=3137852 RepID=A0ABM9NSJ8_9FLAO